MYHYGVVSSSLSISKLKQIHESNPNIITATRREEGITARKYCTMYEVLVMLDYAQDSAFHQNKVLTPFPNSALPSNGLN